MLHVPAFATQFSQPMRTLSAKIIAIQVFFLVVALTSIGMTLLVSWELEGGAAAINDAGSLRMRAYRLAYFLADGVSNDPQRGVREELLGDVHDFEAVLTTLRLGDPARPLFLPKEAAIDALFHDVEARWRPIRAAAVMRAGGTAASIGKGEVGAFVAAINELVLRIEKSISSTTNILRLFQLGLVALAVAGTIALIYLAFLVVIGPVQRLREGMERMARADFSVCLPVESRDEFGQLARGFNDMADRLRDLYQNLETRVAQKTQSLAERNGELTALYGIGAFLAEPQALDALCRGFLERITTEFRADAGAVRFIGADASEGSQVHLFASRNLPDEFIAEEHCIRVDACACGTAASGEVPIHWADLQHYTEPHDACRKQRFASLSAVPIRAQNETLGVLNLFFRTPRVMSTGEQTLLATLSQQLGVAVENQRLVSREKEMAISEERNLLAQELHDSIAQSLAFLNLQVQMLGSAMKREDRTAAQGATHEIEAGVRECYADVRELLLHFRTRSSHADIGHALRVTLKKFEQQTGIRVVLVEKGQAMPIPAEAQVQVLHIIQEALSNVRKHAGADTVDVTVQRGPVYTFVVRDNGRGFEAAGEANPGESELHVGLKIMRERARRAGADLLVDSHPGKGTCVTLNMAVSAFAPAELEAA